jgi:hypothetical protein
VQSYGDGVPRKTATRNPSGTAGSSSVAANATWSESLSPSSPVTQWLRHPANPPQFYAESLVKLFFAGQAGDLAATRSMLEHERDLFAARLAEFELKLPLLQADPEHRYPAMTLELGIRLHRLMIEWAEQAIADVKRDGG